MRIQVGANQASALQARAVQEGSPTMDTSPGASSTAGLHNKGNPDCSCVHRYTRNLDRDCSLIRIHNTEGSLGGLDWSSGTDVSVTINRTGFEFQKTSERS